MKTLGIFFIICYNIFSQQKQVGISRIKQSRSDLWASRSFEAILLYSFDITLPNIFFPLLVRLFWRYLDSCINLSSLAALAKLGFYGAHLRRRFGTQTQLPAMSRPTRNKFDFDKSSRTKTSKQEEWVCVAPQAVQLTFIPTKADPTDRAPFW